MQEMEDSMKPWKEIEFWENTTWYHATQAGFAKSIIKNGVIANINNNKPLDFGYGFYLTPNKEWATNYLIEQTAVLEGDNAIEENRGYILEFSFCPREYIGEFEYRFFEKLDYEFAKFVFQNRRYYKYHIFSKCVHSYELIGGPMSDGKQIDDFLEYELHRITKGELFERLLEPKEDWQLLLHNQELCGALVLNKIYNMKGDEIDVNDI